MPGLTLCFGADVVHGLLHHCINVTREETVPPGSGTEIRRGFHPDLPARFQFSECGCRCVRPSPASDLAAPAAAAPLSPVPPVMLASSQASQPPVPTRSPRQFALCGGLGSASGGWGIDHGAGLSYAFPVGRSGLAARVQGDTVRFQDSGRGVGGITADATQNIFGATAVAEYTFHTSSGTVAPYLLGRLGFCFSSFSYDITVPGYGSDAGHTSDSDVGLALGGGVRFGGRFFAELRVIPFFSGGSMVPLMVGLRP